MPLIAPVFACAGCELHSCSCKAFFVPVSEAVCVPPPPGINFSCQCTADCFRHGPCCCSAGIVSQYVLLANANFTLLQITPNSHQRPVLKHGCAQDQGRQRDLTCLQVHETPSHHFLAPPLRRCKQAACQQARRQVQCHLALLPGALALGRAPHQTVSLRRLRLLPNQSRRAVKHPSSCSADPGARDQRRLRRVGSLLAPPRAKLR